MACRGFYSSHAWCLVIAVLHAAEAYILHTALSDHIYAYTA
jgi:hypothetical protein